MEKYKIEEHLWSLRDPHAKIKRNGENQQEKILSKHKYLMKHYSNFFEDTNLNGDIVGL